MNVYIDGAADVGRKLIGYAAYDEAGNLVCAGYGKGNGSNTAELTAILQTIKVLPAGSHVISTDSANVIGWMNMGWRIKGSNIVALCREIETETQLLFQRDKSFKTTLAYARIKGHSGVHSNELADKKAKQMLDEARNATAQQQE